MSALPITAANNADLSEEAKQTDAGKYTMKNAKKGAFVRSATIFHNQVSSDKDAEFPVASGRYHLYVSLACPWANRCMAMRALMGLKDHITVSVVEPTVKDMTVWDKYLGWHFDRDFGETKEPHGFKTLSEVYELAAPGFRASYTDEKMRPYYSVPVLFDLQSKKIVSNESADIVRMFNGAFREAFSPDAPDMYPPFNRAQIDAANEWVYPHINDGVYRTGFAGSQEAHDDAFDALFEHLDKADDVLSKQRYIAGASISEADVRLFMTLIRFDPVYVGYFKCNKKRIQDYTHLSGYVREMYQLPWIKETIFIKLHIKQHYYTSHPNLNPNAIVPRGPDLSYLDAPHGREGVGQ